MKKVIAFMLSLCLLLMAGCKASVEVNDSGVYKNDKYDGVSAKTISGKDIVFEEEEYITGDLDMGFAFVIPESWRELANTNISIASQEAGYEISVIYYADEAAQKLENFDFDNASDDELKAIYEEISVQMFDFMRIYRVTEGDKATEVKPDEMKDAYEKNELLVSSDGESYYMAYNSKLEGDKFTENDAANIETLVEGIQSLKDGIMLFTPSQSAGFEGNLSSFTSEDMAGNEITQDIFKDYDITMVNVWATWCGFCVEEMPELQRLYTMLPDNVNMITICDDAEGQYELASQILADCSADFVTVKGNDEITESLIQYLSGFPTTVFVDSEGKVVGGIQTGAPSKTEIAEAYMKLIENRLKFIGE